MANKYVYVIGPELGGQLKIGIGTDVAKRLSNLQCGNPSRLALHYSASIPAHLAPQVQDHAHWLLYDCRGSGEWFTASAEFATKAVKDAIASAKKYKPKTKDRTSVMLAFRVPAYLAYEIDRILKGGEGRSDFIRAAIHQELIRRKDRK